MEVKNYVQGIDGKVKELTITNADGTITKFIPEARKEEVVIEAKAEKKASKK